MNLFIHCQSIPRKKDYHFKASQRLRAQSRLFCLLLGVFFLGVNLHGCFSPRYSPPALTEAIPVAYKHPGTWQEARPQETLDKGSWWTLFQDPTLNALMDDLNATNQKIAIAAANYRQAKAQTAQARSDFFPVVQSKADLSRSHTEGSPLKEHYSLGAGVQWEVSVWNTLSAFSSASLAQSASAADYAALKLSMQAELVQTYVQLRVLDVQIGLYEATIAAYAKAVQLTRSQFQGGIVTAADVAQAETQLASTEAQLADMHRRRAAFETSIAILTGRMPSAFSLERSALIMALPNVPRTLPSALLERRPDIAAAERRVAAANESIGIARSAWFPIINLSADRALQGSEFFSSPLTVWTLGPAFAINLLQGGKTLAATEAAWASYEKEAASYRQIVLESFKEVEDTLAALHYLRTQEEAQIRAVRASQMALRLSLSQYQGGLTTYLQVVNTQTAALSNEGKAIEVQGQNILARIELIKALGGGWDLAALGELIQDGGPQEGKVEHVW